MVRWRTLAGRHQAGATATPHPHPGGLPASHPPRLSSPCSPIAWHGQPHPDRRSLDDDDGEMADAGRAAPGQVPPQRHNTTTTTYRKPRHRHRLPRLSSPCSPIARHRQPHPDRRSLNGDDGERADAGRAAPGQAPPQRHNNTTPHTASHATSLPSCSCPASPHGSSAHQSQDETLSKKAMLR